MGALFRGSGSRGGGERLLLLLHEAAGGERSTKADVVDVFCRRWVVINWQLVSNRKCTIKLQWSEGARCHRRPMASAEVGLSSGSRRRPIKPMRSRTRSDSGRRETRFFPFSSSLLFSLHQHPSLAKPIVGICSRCSPPETSLLLASACGRPAWAPASSPLCRRYPSTTCVPSRPPKPNPPT